MKTQQKKRVLQKLWGWACLSINCLIIALFLSEKNMDYLTGGILLSLLIFCYGVAKTQADKGKDDLSSVSVAIEYICVYIITFIAAIKALSQLSSVVMLILVIIASLSELIIFVLITCWYTIRKGTRRRFSCLHRKIEGQEDCSVVSTVKTK